MTRGVVNTFAGIERLLAAPPADGMFLTFVKEGSPLHAAGVSAGDIVVAVGEVEGPDLRAFYQGLQPQGPEDATRPIRVRKTDGTVLGAEVSLPLRGCSACAVKEGKSAWVDLPDTGDAPGFGGLADGTEIWLRNSLEEERAGFERVFIRRTGGLIEVDTLFRLGGGQGGGSWDYRAKALTVHRMDRYLSIVRTAFREGLPGEEKLAGDVSLGADGIWRGVHGDLEGGTKYVEFASRTPHSITPYSVMLLPLTMPLEEGARLTVCMAGDGTGEVTARSRIECVGREEVEVDGRSVSAWCFLWRHYGEYGTEERFCVSEDRRLLRIDWGPNYGGCWAELVNQEHVLAGVPEHVKIE